MSSDFWVITSYFNPARYKTKRLNFEAFMAGMESVGANVLVVEMAFGDEPFELEPGERLLQFRGDSVMWQKERLLNVAAARLPDSCRKVGWFDADLIFKEPDWLERTSAALDEHMVVQPFSVAVRMNRDNRDDGTGLLSQSFASVFVRDPAPGRVGNFHAHGHTGFAWAARREFFEQCGLYEASLTGAGDHLMAHAFIAGMANSPCMRHVFTGAPKYSEHFIRWGVKARDLAGGKIGVVPGRILHMWHGDPEDRAYGERLRQFRVLGFDPDKHLRHGEGGMLEWTDEAPAQIKQWCLDMFHGRNEDGERKAAPDAAARQARGKKVASR
jgi:hypothetical protein